MRTNPAEEDCKHNQGFFFSPYMDNITISFIEKTALPGVFKCVHNCGFWLRFDPNKFVRGIVYTTMPPKSIVEGKERPVLPPLSTEGKY